MSGSRKIRQVPHPVLDDRAEEVPKGEDCNELIAAMFDAMYAKDGMGLAAPQIGVSKRVIVGHQRKEGWKFVLINPEIRLMREPGRVRREGCLSVPGSVLTPISVVRYNYIKVRGFDVNWKPITVGGKWWKAACLQHELDHLDGLTIERFRNE